MDRRPASPWTVEGQLYPQPGAEGASGTDSLPQKFDRGTVPRNQPASKNPGGREYQIGFRGEGYQWEKLTQAAGENHCQRNAGQR